MSGLERPCLRPHLAAAPDGREGVVVIWDRLRLTDDVVRVSALEWSWLRLFDGRHTLRDVQVEAIRRLGGRPVPLDVLQRLARQLDDSLFLDGPRYQERFRDLAAAPIRPPSCTTSYGAHPENLRRQLDRLFTGPGGAGRPGVPRPDERFQAALVPHIDYARGGRSYTWAFKEVFERTPARLFVIVGTSHYSLHRFTLTRKHFQTPLGIVPTDQDYIDRLVRHHGDGLFDDEVAAHLPEHSIELEVVFLQYLYTDRPFRIVPLLVGSFQDCIEDGREPAEQEDIGRMIEALRAAERETAEPICYLISGDLAHIGPKFGDARPLEPPDLEHSRAQDQVVLSQAEKGDPASYFRAIADEGDRRRICGLPPTYVVLRALAPGTGKVLHYDQYVHPTGYESVSFASAGFYR
jgi:AmmeMemoRadiSam system protein B